jgi:hypothetical protein
MGALQAQSRAAMQVAARVPVYRLARPQEGWSLEAVLQQVKQRSFLLAG